MQKNPGYQTGFTLIEIAIVLLVVTIILGYTVAMFPIQQELKQYRSAETEMSGIISHLVAFAQINGRLPCPDSDGDGVENPTGGGADCTDWSGNLPGQTLGIDGDYSAAGVLQDPWGSAYLYQVTSSDTNADGGDFVILDNIQTVGISNVIPDLEICNIQPGAHTAAAPNVDTGCDNANETVVENIAAVVVSLGKDRGQVNSDIQSENNDVGASNDVVFVSTTKSDIAGAEYDDVVKWLSANRLIAKMIEADQLP